MLEPVEFPVTFGDRLRNWWRKKLNSDSVREFIPHYNIAWLAWAVLALFALPAVATVSESMGWVAYWWWVGLAIPANALPIIGLRMRHGGQAIQEMSEKLLKLDWWGLSFQAAGHALACGLLIVFEISCIITVVTYDGPALYAGLTVFAMFVLFPWLEGTFLLCAQCLAKIERGKQIEKQGGVL